MKKKKVLILNVADEDHKKLEANFITELSLALEGLKVDSCNPDPKKNIPHPPKKHDPQTSVPEVLYSAKSVQNNKAETFISLPLNHQIKRIKKILSEKDAFAAIWLTVNSSSVYVHLIVIQTNRVLVRMIKKPLHRQDFPTDLAMATRELIGEAFLFGKKPKTKGLKKIVASVTRKVTPKIVSNWALRTSAAISGGIYGQMGGYFSAGGITTLRQRLSNNTGLRYSFSMIKGSWGWDEGVFVDSQSFGLGVGIDYKYNDMRDHKKIKFGPVLEINSVWSDYTVHSSPILYQYFSQWRVELDLGMEATYKVSSHISVVVALFSGFTSNRKVLSLQTSGRKIFSSPFILWKVSGGLSFSF